MESAFNIHATWKPQFMRKRQENSMPDDAWGLPGAGEVIEL
jgi:hypothetical protein